MAIDEAIAFHVRKGMVCPTLRLYGWEKASVSLGVFQKSTDINLSYCLDNGIPVVRRPTGGRGILHGDELTYSVSAQSHGLFSSGLLETYHHLGAALQRALEISGLNVTMKAERTSGRTLARNPLCFQTTSYGEISFQGHKIVGSAQKRWSNGFLQQGSIPYTLDQRQMERIFTLTHNPGERLTMVALREIAPELSHESLKRALQSSFEEIFAIRFRAAQLAPEEESLAEELESRRHSSPAWVYQR